MRYYIKYNDEKRIGYMEYPYENQTMTEVTESEYFRLRKEDGLDDKEHWENCYQDLTKQYIHEKYSYDDENKVIREYLSDQSNTAYKQAFDEYNAYVLECKSRAKEEILLNNNQTNYTQ